MLSPEAETLTPVLLFEIRFSDPVMLVFKTHCVLPVSSIKFNFSVPDFTVTIGTEVNCSPS